MQTRNIEAIVVLGSGKYESQRRARTALEVYRKFGLPDCRVFACGKYPRRTTFEKFEKVEKTEAEYIADVFLDAGIPIELDSESRNTYENIVNVREGLSGLSNIAIVTTRGHISKSQRIAEKVLGKKNIRYFGAQTNNFKELFSDFAYLVVGLFV